jgi:MoxR-like ATPase
MTSLAIVRPPQSTASAVEASHDAIDTLRFHLNAALRGKPQANELVIACLLARGHLLIEDTPGVGKTTLAKSLAQAVGGRFARVQCTPDLLPTDVTGFKMFNQQSREFEFIAGPVFCDVLLADELNRATPRTQSALFEAMAERQVSIDGEAHPLPDAFFVIATQNPLESHGVYPLPEAQLDRFSVRLRIGYPDPESESQLLADDGIIANDLAAAGAGCIDPTRLLLLQQTVREVFVAQQVRDYIVRLGNWTREQAQIECGLSPRALLTWQRLAKAWAFLSGRSFVIPDDLHHVAGPVLEMRLGGGSLAAEFVESMLAEVPVPVTSR